MSRTGDYVIDLMNTENAWVNFIGELFKRMGYDVQYRDENLIYDEHHPDLNLTKDNKTVIVELKLHRSSRVPLALFRNALNSVQSLIEDSNAFSGILIIPQRISLNKYATIISKSSQKIEFWDLDILTSQVRQFPELSFDFAELLRLLQIGAEYSPEGPIEIVELGDNPDQLPPIGQGTKLANEIEDLPAGSAQNAAQKYESLCEEALKLMFQRDLLGWRSQASIENGFQRVDVIARLQPSQSAFWTTIASDFRTRYVVFEFKNYSDKITQDQIYSTERYLFTSALRSVAILIAKNGAAESANRAIQGALREQGKLILCITGSEFCSMLRGFDNGNNPEEFLLQKRDDLLMSLAR